MNICLHHVQPACCTPGCTGLPPALPYGRWRATRKCTAACPSDSCAGICNTTAGFKGAPVARCTQRGWAAVKGGCTPVLCPVLPAAAGAGVNPWPATCAGAALNSTCSTSCNATAGYIGNATARCALTSAGLPQWAKTDNRCVKLAPAPCLGTPPFSLGRQAVWEKDCNGTLAGSKCFARCSGPYEVSRLACTHVCRTAQCCMWRSAAAYYTPAACWQRLALGLLQQRRLPICCHQIRVQSAAALLHIQH